MTDLNKFYELNWVHHLPKIMFVPDRKTIDELKSEKTEPWLVGWTEGRIVYILDRSSFDRESDHKYSDLYYRKLIKHELSHLFYYNIAQGRFNPRWLSEGTAIYISGQNSERIKPSSFSNFLEFYDKKGKAIYEESGFAVQCLVGKYGKEKLLELIKNLCIVKSEQEFGNLFKRVYRFFPNYSDFNKLLMVSTGTDR